MCPSGASHRECTFTSALRGLSAVTPAAPPNTKDWEVNVRARQTPRALLKCGGLDYWSELSDDSYFFIGSNKNSWSKIKHFIK